MRDWAVEPLGELAEIRSSNVDKKSNAGEQRVRLCNYMDVYSRPYITEDIDFMEATATAAEIQRFGVERGDVLITKDSETPDDIGIPAVVLDDIENLVCGYHLALIKPTLDEVDSIYLAKQLATVDTARYFGRLANGSTRYGLSYRSIAGTPIRIAPLRQQQRIAEILRTVDEAIAQTEALIAKTRRIKAGLMHDLFTRGVTPDGKLRPPREEAPKLYKESPLGCVPNSWEVETLADVGTWISGGTPSKLEARFWGGSVPWVTPKDMKVFRLEGTQDSLTDQGAMVGSRIVPQGSVFVVVRGMILAHTFPVCLTSRTMAFNQDIPRLLVRGEQGPNARLGD
jgi:type I restriction enzyme S subunit